MKQSATATRTAAPALTPSPVQSLQRQCACGDHASGGECDGCKAKRRGLQRGGLHRMPGSGGTPSNNGTPNSTRTPNTSAQEPSATIREKLRTGGQPLERDLRTTMESRFRHDFSRVRVHTGAGAGESARMLGAHAWTLGSDVVFAQGAYDTRSARGQRLIAHELAHVVQQSGAAAVEPQKSLQVSAPGDAAETEAERAADKVMSGEPARVARSADGKTVHRLSAAASVGLAVGGTVLGIAAVAGLIAVIASLFEDTDPSKIEHPPACGPKQNKIIDGVYKTAIEWLNKTLAKVHAFQANSGSKESAFFRDRLRARFKSDTPETLGTVERTTAQILRLMRVESLKRKCRGEEDSLCKGFAAAYTDREKGEVTFCGVYFKSGKADVGSIVHEYAHAVTGGAEVADRGYQNERVIRSVKAGEAAHGTLSTDEALTNAESYSEFIQEMAQGSAFLNPIPQDKEDCPEGTKPIVDAALARAERMNTNMENVFLDSKEENQAQKFVFRNAYLPNPAPTAPLGPAAETSTDAAAAPTAPQIADVRHICGLTKKTAGALHSPVEISCVGGAAECPKGARATFKSGDKTIYVCAGWIGEADPQVQTTEMLAAIYGALGGEARSDWQTGLARMAFAITTGTFSMPKHEDIVGSAAWTKDLLQITVALPKRPKGAKGTYSVGPSPRDEKLSADVPEYRETTSTGLPLQFNEIFLVDNGGKRRPGPFTPPVLTLEYTYARDGIGKDAANSGTAEDRDPVYQGEGAPLKSKLGIPVLVTMHGSGTFTLTVQMADVDSGFVRLYHDAIRVVEDLPAPAPGVGAPAPTAATAAAPAPAPAPATPAAPPAPPTAPARKPVSVCA